LFQPRDPRDAQAGGIGQFFAAQARGAAAGAGPGGRQAGAVGADEGAEHLAPVRLKHGVLNTSINRLLVTGKRMLDNGFPRSQEIP
jgi:hypothetical protein